MLVTTAAISGTRNDVPPKRTVAKITKVMAAVTKETIRSPRHNGSNQNERNFTRTPSYSFPWIVPIILRRCLEFPGDCTLGRLGAKRRDCQTNLQTIHTRTDPINCS
jgi:hypothetical protein